jgi:hypothetical protein
LFTGLSAAQINEALDACASRRKVLILDCCYSGAFPAGVTAKADEAVNTLERFQGKGRAVLTASDATQYSFEGDSLEGAGSQSVFTRYLVEAIRTGEADLDADGDIALDELYSYVHEKVVAERPQQRPKKQEDVDGRILIARNVHWTLPTHLRYAIDSPISAQRLTAVEGLAHLHRVGNELVRAVVDEQVAVLATDDSRSVSSAATALLERFEGSGAGAAEVVAPAPVPPPRESPEPASVAARPADPPPLVTAPVEVPALEAEHQATAPPTHVGSAPASLRPTPEAAMVRPAGAEPAEPRSAAGGPGDRTRRTLAIQLGLVVVGAVLLTFSRTLVFVASYDDTAQQFYDSRVPWIALVAVPLGVTGVLLAWGWWRRRALPWALGLLLGVGLVLTGSVFFWSAYFMANRDSYTPGPAFGFFVGGWAVLVAAGVLALRRPPIGSPAALVTDWRVVWAVVVLACLVASVGTGSDESTVAGWLAKNAGAIVLAGAALPLTLLRLDRVQRLVGLVAISLFGLWTVFFPIRALVTGGDGDFSSERADAPALLACTVITVAVCFLAQRDRPAVPAEAR